MIARLLIPAAGMGERLGASGPKALVEIAGTPMLVRTLRRFQPAGLLDDAIITAPAEHHDAFRWMLDHAFPGHSIRVITGGAQRQDSVRIGLEAMVSNADVAVIHDAARPFVPLDAIQLSLNAAMEHGAATVAIPCADTILEADENTYLHRTPPRERLWACQTPQTFRRSLILEAHRKAVELCQTVTDDATLVREQGHAVKLIKGHPLNLKITWPADLELAHLIVRENLI